MKNKKWLILLIIGFPSFFWLILETSTINSKKLPYYGPKTLISKGDTNYYTVAGKFYPDPGAPTSTSVSEPVYAAIFLSKRYRADAYRLAGLWEYLNYKTSKVEHIPFILITGTENGHSRTEEELNKLAAYKNVHFYYWPERSLDSLANTYFAGKPYYIDYSFFLLVDANRHIRGYYDGRYVSELKRLIEEYQHLRLKEEKQKLIEDNEIKSPA